MKHAIFTIALILVASPCFSGEKIQEYEVFDKKLVLPDGCEAANNKEKGKSNISCSPEDYSYLVYIDILKPIDCSRDRINELNSAFEISELVNTTVNGYWYYELKMFRAGSGVTIYERIIRNNKQCLSVKAGKREILEMFTKQLWL